MPINGCVRTGIAQQQQQRRLNMVLEESGGTEENFIARWLDCSKE